MRQFGRQLALTNLRRSAELALELGLAAESEPLNPELVLAGLAACS
jgi:hypothetical protein